MKNVNRHISLTLKELRRQRGWSLDKAAEQTGVSKAMLGQIEREESSPTIATLWKITSGFKTSFSSFIEDLQKKPQATIYRAEHLKTFDPLDDKIEVHTLFPFDPQIRCEIVKIVLLPGCEHHSPAHFDVIEDVIVLEGKVEVLVDGQWQALNKGDGLRFEANQAHAYRNRLSKKAVFHNIIHYVN